MRYSVIVCLSLTLGSCSSAGSYGGVRSYAVSSVSDLGGCGISPVPLGREDKICNRQNGNPYGN
jgi:hypothetical protein